MLGMPRADLEHRGEAVATLRHVARRDQRAEQECACGKNGKQRGVPLLPAHSSGSCDHGVGGLLVHGHLDQIGTSLQQPKGWIRGSRRVVTVAAWVAARGHGAGAPATPAPGHSTMMEDDGELARIKTPGAQLLL